MERILITGGAGFIGSALISELRRNGHEIFVVDNLSFGNRHFILEVPDDHYFDIDILDRLRLKDCFLSINPTWVIHLAAVHFIPFCNEHPFLASNINIQGSMNVVDSCVPLNRLKKILFASTAAVYPVLDDAISEDTDPAPSDIYGLSKLAGERILSDFHLKTQIPTIICRFFNAFGPNETNPHLIPAIQDQINNGTRKLKLGNLEPKRDYIHTHDMARAVNLLLQKFHSGYDIFNLGSGSEFSVREIVRAFEEELGEKLIVEQDPSRVRKTDRMHLLADVRKLSEFISWSPQIDINTGIRTLIRHQAISNE